MDCALCTHDHTFHDLAYVLSTTVDMWTCSYLNCNCPAFVMGSKPDADKYNQLWFEGMERFRAEEGVA